jgi:hypothetical protein
LTASSRADVQHSTFGRQLWQAWNAYVKRASEYQSAVLLNAVYLFVVGPSALVARMFGTQLMDLSRREQASSWLPRRREPLTLDDLKRQF